MSGNSHEIEENLCQALDPMMVAVSWLVDVASGVNDMLNRDGTYPPKRFPLADDSSDQHPLEVRLVQAATRWRRMALKQFGMYGGAGLGIDPECRPLVSRHRLRSRL